MRFNNDCLNVFSNMPFACCFLPDNDIKKGKDMEKLLLRGVSVYYLQTVLPQEMKDAGIDYETATIYDLEDLRSKKYGLIRRKSANTICPRDGKLGAAYVNTIEQHPDHVGRVLLPEPDININLVFVCFFRSSYCLERSK